MSSLFLSITLYIFFFFNDPSTTEIYTLSLHDALPISRSSRSARTAPCASTSGSSRRPTSTSPPRSASTGSARISTSSSRSEEHTSELQSQSNLVCRLLLEKKKKEIEALHNHSLISTI